MESISTGSLSLDVALGIGGLPKGRIVEIYGPESSGKTTLALHVIAEAQKNGDSCAFMLKLLLDQLIPLLIFVLNQGYFPRKKAAIKSLQLHQVWQYS